MKTYDNAISVDRHGKAYPTLLEQAKSSGLATGDITTSEIQDATPAVEVSHISQRSCYGPVATTTTCPEAAKENGGRGSITEQLLDTRPDVTLGGGSATFAEVAKAGQVAGQDARAAGQGARLPLHHRQGRPRPASRTADQDKPLLGLFSPGNMPVKFAPLLATVGRGRPAGRELPARADLQPGARAQGR